MSGLSPSTVGNKFVLSFYTHMNKNPQELQRFYKENSVLTNGSEGTFGANEETVCGVEEINKKIQHLDFRNARVTLSVVDCQASSNGGVIVMVVGHLSNKEEPFRKFVQTFFLAEQQKGSFYVLNDIFRFLDDGKTNEPSSVPTAEYPVTEEPSRPPLQEHREPESKPKEQMKPVQPPSEANSTSSKENTGENQPTKISTPPTKSSNQPQSSNTAMKPAVSTQKASTPEEKPVPKTWSNVAAQPETTNNLTSTPPQPTKTPPPTNKPATRLPIVDKIPSGSALFINNVPFNATEDQLKVVFTKFGQIQNASIIPQKGYGFLAFTTVEAAQKAIQSGKDGELVIDGRTLSVEERRPKKDGFKDRKDDRGQRNSRGEEKRGDRDDRRNTDKKSSFNGKPSRDFTTEKRS